jgi:hypothetical protein
MRRRPGYALNSLHISGSCDNSLKISLMLSSSLNIFWSQDLSSGKEKNSIPLSDCVNLITWSPCMPYHESSCFSQRKTCPLFMLMIGSKVGKKEDCTPNIYNPCIIEPFQVVLNSNGTAHGMICSARSTCVSPSYFHLSAEAILF